MPHWRPEGSIRLKTPGEPTNAGMATGIDKSLGHLAMLLFAALIAGSFSFGSMAAPFIDPAALNAIRFFFASILMGMIAVAVYGQPPRFPAAPWRFAILGFLMAVYFVLMFVALRIASPVSTGAVFTLIPLMSAAFGWLFLRQRTAPIVLFSLVVAAAGAIWVIFGGRIAAILAFNLGTGELIYLVGCAAHAAYVPLVRKFRRAEPLVLFTFHTLLATFLWVALWGAPAILATNWLALPGIVWFAIGYLFIFTTGLTFFLVQFAAVRLPSSKVLSYGYLTPAFIIVLEGLLGHGWAAPAIFAGAVVTAMALLVMALASDS
jgi:drug/metabolite transporter (DMT)-like permease